jgi:endonuclease-3
MPKESMANKRARAVAVCELLALRYPGQECLLEHNDPFTLIIAVLLSAQTTDAAVNKITPELFSRWPNALEMAGASEAEVAQVIRSIGFFRVKAANCVKLARMLLADFGGEVPQTMQELVSLPGVGRKTANIVLNSAFGIVTGIAVDTHVFRVAHKLGFSPASHNTAEKVERDLLATFPQELWGAINHQWVLFGREICSARKPRCDECPLVGLCPSAGKS